MPLFMVVTAASITQYCNNYLGVKTYKS